MISLSLTTEKHRLVNLLASYGIREPVLSLFEEVPRELFVAPQYEHAAYQDRALPTLSGQTISQPSLVAQTLQTLNLKHTDKVLEIGTGSGFQTALLTKLAGKVYSIERLANLTDSAKRRLKKLGLKNVQVITSDGSEGYSKGAPYDVIIVTATFHEVPKPLVDQLAEEGKLVMPVGRESWQELVLYQKRQGKLVRVKKIAHVRFVPFIGKYAFQNS